MAHTGATFPARALTIEASFPLYIAKWVFVAPIPHPPAASAAQENRKAETAGIAGINTPNSTAGIG